jgi:hypothetical protein
MRQVFLFTGGKLVKTGGGRGSVEVKGASVVGQELGGGWGSCLHL